MDSQIFGRPESFYKEHGAIKTAQEIARQPRLWREMGKALLNRKDELASFMDKTLAVPGLRVVFTGAGSSAFVGEALRDMLANEMSLRAEAVHTTDFISAPDANFIDMPTLLISFARSGESPESMATVRFAQKRIKELYQVIVVCDKHSSLAKLGYASDKALVLDMPPQSCDAGFAMTSSVSCMALATWCLFHYKELDKYVACVNLLADGMEKDFPSFWEKAREIAQFPYRRIIFLGTGALRGLAREGAVKSMEVTDGYVHAGYDASTGFRHGPKTVVNNETLTVHFISNLPYCRQYDEDLIEEMLPQRRGNRILAVSPVCSPVLDKTDYAVEYELPAALPEASEMGAYINGLVFLQLLSLEKSLERGNTTDSPSRSGDVNRVVKGVIIHEI